MKTLATRSDARSSIKFRHALADQHVGRVDDSLSQYHGMPIFGWVRVSGREQNRQKNMDRQARNLLLELKKRGFKVQWIFRAVASGWDTNREEFEHAVWIAKRENGVLVAEGTDRFIRSADYHSSNNPGAQPSRGEWKSLQRTTKGVKLFTIQPPSASFSESRSYQSKRAGSNCGRPKGQKMRRAEWLPLVLDLRESGHSYKKITAKTGISTSTFRYWFKRCGLDGAVGANF